MGIEYSGVVLKQTVLKINFIVVSLKGKESKMQ